MLKSNSLGFILFGSHYWDQRTWPGKGNQPKAKVLALDHQDCIHIVLPIDHRDFSFCFVRPPGFLIPFCRPGTAATGNHLHNLINFLGPSLSASHC